MYLQDEGISVQVVWGPERIAGYGYFPRKRGAGRSMCDFPDGPRTIATIDRILARAREELIAELLSDGGSLSSRVEQEA